MRKATILATIRRAAVTTAIALLSAKAPLAAQLCPGDCNQDGLVTIDELILGARITLGQSPISACAALNFKEDARITIDELARAVQSGVNGCPQTLAFVTATNFVEGGFATVSLDPPRMVDPVTPQRLLHSDSVPRVFRDLLFAVNRFGGDSIRRLDSDFTTISDCSTGAGTNPQDIAVLHRDKGYVTLLGSTELLVVDPTPEPDCSNFILDTIDLSEFAEPKGDGFPEMDQMAIVDGLLYVSLQKLLNFSPARLGGIAVIDTSADEVLGEITLTGQNPFSNTKGLTVREGRLYVGEAGLLGTNDGGIETIDLERRQAEGFLITEAALGGDLNDFVIVSDRLGYAVIAAADFTTSLVAFDPSEGRVTDTILSGVEFISDIELNDRGELYALDRSFSAPGVRVFGAADGVELTEGAVDVGLPPFQLVFLR